MPTHPTILVCRECKYDRFFLKHYPTEQRLELRCVGCGTVFQELATKAEAA